MTTNTTKEKMPYVFGSSTPRDFSYLNQIPAKYRIYNVRMKSHNYQTSQTGGDDSTDQMTLKDFLREIRRAASPQRAAGRRDRSADAANARMFVFGSSTPRELSYLERVPHEFRLIDAVTHGKFLAVATTGPGHGGGFGQEKRSKTTHNFTNAHANASACGEKLVGAGAASKAKAAKIQYLNRRSSSISSTSNENTLSTPPKVTFSTPNGDHPERKPQNGTASATARSSRRRSARTRSVPATVNRVNAQQLDAENERMSRDISKKAKEITTKVSTQKTQRKKTLAKAPPASMADKAKIAKMNVEDQKIEPKSPISVIQSSPEPLSKTDDDELTFSSPEPPKMIPSPLEPDHVTVTSSNVTHYAIAGDQVTREVHVLEYESSKTLDGDSRTPGFKQSTSKLQDQIFPDEFMISNQSKVPQVEDFHSIPKKPETKAQEYIVKEGSSENLKNFPEMTSKTVDDSKIEGQIQISEVQKIDEKPTILEINHFISDQAQPDFFERINEVSHLGRVESPKIVVYEEREPQVQDENMVDYPSDASPFYATEPMLEEISCMEKDIEYHAEQYQNLSRNLESSSPGILHHTKDESHTPVDVPKMDSGILNLEDSQVEQEMIKQVHDATIENVHSTDQVGVQEMENAASILHGKVLEPVPVLEQIAQSRMGSGEPRTDVDHKAENLDHAAMSLHKEDFEPLPVHVLDQIFEGTHSGLEEQVENMFMPAPVENQKHFEQVSMPYKDDHFEQYEYNNKFEDKTHAMEAQHHIHLVDKVGESVSPIAEKSMSMVPQPLKRETEPMPAHQQFENFDEPDYDQEVPEQTHDKPEAEFQCSAGDLIRTLPSLYNEDIEPVNVDHFETYEHRHHVEDQAAVEHETLVHPISELRKVEDSLNDEAHHPEPDQISLSEGTHDEPEVSTFTAPNNVEEYSESVPTNFEAREDRHHHHGFEDQATIMESVCKQDVHHETEERKNNFDQGQFESHEIIMEGMQYKHPDNGKQEKSIQEEVERLIFTTPFMEHAGHGEYQINEIEHRTALIHMDPSLAQSPHKLGNEVEEHHIESKVENFNQLVPSLLKKDLELAQEESTILALEPLTLSSEMTVKNQDFDPSALSAPEMPSPHTKTPTHTPTSASSVCMEDMLPQLLKKNFAFLDEEPYMLSKAENGSHMLEMEKDSTRDQQSTSCDELSQHQYIVEEPVTPNHIGAIAVDGQFFDQMAQNVVEDSIEEAKKYVSDSNPQIDEVESPLTVDDFDREKQTYGHAYDDEDSDQSGLELDQHESVENYSNNKCQSINLPLADQDQVGRGRNLENIPVQNQVAETSPRTFDTVDYMVGEKVQDEDHRINESDDSGVQDIYIYSLQKYEDNLDKLDLQSETTVVTIVDPQVFDKRFQYGEDFFAPNVVAQSLMSPKRDNELLEKTQDFDDQSTKSHESLIKDYSHDFCDNSSSSSVSVVVASTKCESEATKNQNSSPRSVEEEDYLKNRSFDKGFETDDERGVWKNMTLNESGIEENMDLTADESAISSSMTGFDAKESELDKFYTRIEKSEPMVQKYHGIIVEPDQVEISMDSSTFRPYYEEPLFLHAHSNGKSGQILDTFSQFLPSSSDDDHFPARPTTTARLDESFPAGILKKQSSSNLENYNNNNNNNDVFSIGAIETDDDSSPISFSKIDFNDSSTSPPITSSPKMTSEKTTAISKSEEQQQQRKIFHFRSEETSSEEDDDENNGNITVEFGKFLQNTEKIDLPEVQFKNSSKLGEDENQSRI